MKSFFTENNRKMRKNLINVGTGTEKDKNNLFSTKNKEKNSQFPNIEIKNRYDINLLNDIIKYNSTNHELAETENEIPIITSKINSKKDCFISNSVKKYKTIDEKINLTKGLGNAKKSYLVLSSVKIPKFNFGRDNNISNINNIYNKNDYLNFYFNSPSRRNNNRNTIIIKTLKNSTSNFNLNDDEKDTILNLLNSKSIVINSRRNNKPKKIMHKDEFKKDFLKEILRQHKDKNINRIKKKIDINILLCNRKIKSRNNINSIKSNNSFFNKTNMKEIKNSFRNDNKKQKQKFSPLILRNEFLNSKLNLKELRIQTEEAKNKKRNIFDIYKFKNNKIFINKVEEELINLENKMKNNLEQYKKKIDDETTNFPLNY